MYTHKKEFILRKKKICALAAATTLVFSLVTTQAAATAPSTAPFRDPVDNNLITPYWTSTNVVVPSITNSGRTISVSALISPKSKDTKSVGTLYLERYTNGQWYEIASWAINQSGTVSVTRSYTGRSGAKYRAKIVVTTGVDRITATSSEISI